MLIRSVDGRANERGLCSILYCDLPFLGRSRTHGLLASSVCKRDSQDYDSSWLLDDRLPRDVESAVESMSCAGVDRNKTGVLECCSGRAATAVTLPPFG
jgi:hypothetical protein